MSNLWFPFFFFAFLFYDSIYVPRYGFKVKSLNIYHSEYLSQGKVVHRVKLEFNSLKIVTLAELCDVVEKIIKNIFEAIFLKHKYCLQNEYYQNGSIILHKNVLFP